MSDPAAIDRLYEWLPEFHRSRDAQRGYPLRALLRVIGEQVAVVEDDIGQLYDDWFIETCADWAVPYIGDLIGYRPVPAAGLSGDPRSIEGRLLNAWLTPRREVANTIAMRRRKGTLHALEQLALDVAGWPAIAIEFYRRLGWAQNLDHLHLERARTARIAGAPERQRGDTCCHDADAHTVDVRRVDSRHRRGRYNIPSIGVEVYRLRAYPVTATPAYCDEEAGSHCYTFSVFGNDAPLFALAPPCAPCADMDLQIPLPLARTRLQTVVQSHPPVARTSADYYGAAHGLAIHAPGWPTRNAPQPIPIEAVVVADLADWTYTAAAGTVALDPERGRLAFPPGQPPRKGVRVDYHYGFSADIGGGEYARPIVQPSARNLARFDARDFVDAPGVLKRVQHPADPLSVYLAARFDAPANAAIAAWDGVAAPSSALLDALALAFTDALADEALYSADRFPGFVLTDELNRLLADQANPASLARANRLLLEAGYGEAIALRFRCYRVGGDGYAYLGEALRQWRTDSPRYAVIEFVQSAVHTEPVHIQLGSGQTLQLRAAERVRPVLRMLDYMADRADAFRVAGAAGSRLVLDGLLIGGRGIQVRGAEGNETSTGDMCEIVIRHCTLVPGWSLQCDCEPKRPSEPSIEMNGSGAALRIEHSIIGSIEITHERTRVAPNAVSISDSIVDATHGNRVALGAGEGRAAFAHLRVLRSTVFGAMTVHAIELAENSIFTGCVEVARRQIGCLRFCYAPPDSRTPRRYHCQPDLVRAIALDALDEAASDAQRSAALDNAGIRVKPRFTSTRYGHPAYAQLALHCATEIVRGADDQSEMGVFHDLFQPQRAANLRARLDEYTPVGMDAGLFYAT
ncbi:MAG TPA: hypothetical protein VGC55_18310 [Dokdonella sp.]